MHTVGFHWGSPKFRHPLEEVLLPDRLSLISHLHFVPDRVRTYVLILLALRTGSSERALAPVASKPTLGSKMVALSPPLGLATAEVALARSLIICQSILL